MGANERAAIQDSAVPWSWQTEHEKRGLFALYLLQFLEIVLNCCNVVLALYQIK